MAMQRLIDIQQSMIEVGRIRLGDTVRENRGDKEVSRPRKLATFRLTSTNAAALESAAAIYGGTVRPWAGAPTEGQYEVTLEASEIHVAIPPMARLCSQFYELWKSGGCVRRCDGETEMLSGEPCKCSPDDDPKERCKITTRISVMLPELPGIGLWRLESHGWNAAKTLPGTVAIFARTGKFVPAVLRAEPRVDKKDGKTRKYVVPVIDFPQFTLAQMAEHEPALLLGGEAPRVRTERVERPELPEPVETPGINPAWKDEGLPF